MSSVDVVDETFIAAPAPALAAVFAQRSAWPRLWPDLRLELFADRGDEGMRWTVTGALVGSMEVWLEPVGWGTRSNTGEAGTVLHYFLRADPSGPDGTPRPLPRWRARAEIARRHRAAKLLALTLKRRMEAGRRPGTDPAPSGGRLRRTEGDAEPGGPGRAG